MPTTQLASSPNAETDPRGVDFDLHLRGIVVAVWYPFWVFVYKYSFDPHVDDSLEVLIAKAESPVCLIAKVMSWSGVFLIPRFFVAPCCNKNRYRLLWYTATIPILLLMWFLNVPRVFR
jgi:hypothetical protein